MKYGSTLLATDFKPRRLQRGLLGALISFFIPRASPDHEPLYRFVKMWYLELDDAGAPRREIGLDSEGRPLFRAPDGRNIGFWTDSTAKFLDHEIHPIPAQEFEMLWEEVLRNQVRHT